MPILYSAVFRGTVNLADFSTITGNFSAVAKEYLEKAARNDGKFTYVVEGTTFNFFTKEGTCESEKSMSITGSQSFPAWLAIFTNVGHTFMHSNNSTWISWQPSCVSLTRHMGGSCLLPTLTNLLRIGQQRWVESWSSTRSPWGKDSFQQHTREPCMLRGVWTLSESWHYVTVEVREYIIF